MSDDNIIQFSPWQDFNDALSIEDPFGVEPDTAQIALYQAYMEGTVPGINAAPAVFTAINKDTAEMHHELVPFDAALAQRMSDRAVRILRATDVGELLPRIATSCDFFECRFCPWAERCWGLAG